MAIQESFSYVADNLFAGTQVQPVVADEVVLDKGIDGEVVRGTVLGRITASGNYVPVDSTATDGSEVAVCILAETVTVSSTADKPAPAYFTGEFNQDALVFGGSDTFEDHKEALRARGIFLKSAVK